VPHARPASAAPDTIFGSKAHLATESATPTRLSSAAKAAQKQSPGSRQTPSVIFNVNGSSKSALAPETSTGKAPTSVREASPGLQAFGSGSSNPIFSTSTSPFGQASSTSKGFGLFGASSTPTPSEQPFGVSIFDNSPFGSGKLSGIASSSPAGQAGKPHQQKATNGTGAWFFHPKLVKQSLGDVEAYQSLVAHDRFLKASPGVSPGGGKLGT